MKYTEWRRPTWTYTFVGLLPTLVVSGLLVLVGDSIWPAVLVYHALCLGIPLSSRCGFKEAGLIRSDARRWLPLTVLLSLLLLTASGLGSRLTSLRALLPEGLELLFIRIRPWRWFVAYSLLLNAFSEEYFWRGFLLPKIGVIRGAVLFWLPHVMAVAIFVEPLKAVGFTLPGLVAGLLWGWMRLNYKTLWPSLVTHLSADMAILYIISQTMRTA